MEYLSIVSTGIVRLLGPQSLKILFQGSTETLEKTLESVYVPLPTIKTCLTPKLITI